MLLLLHKCPTFLTKQDACKSQQQVHVLSNCLTVQMANLTIHYFLNNNNNNNNNNDKSVWKTKCIFIVLYLQ